MELINNATEYCSNRHKITSLKYAFVCALF